MGGSNGGHRTCTDEDQATEEVSSLSSSLVR